MGPTRTQLAKLFLSLFTTDELRRLLRELPGGEEVVDELPEGTGRTTVADRAAEALTHRGLVGRELRDRLLAARPNRADDIATHWGRAVESRRGAMVDALAAALGDAGVSPDNVEEYLEAEGAETEDLLYETFRSMAFGKSRAAWPFMARMTADYLRNLGGKPDAFFKRTAWLLERVEDEDLAIFMDALRSSLALLAHLATPEAVARHGVKVGIEWDYSDTSGFYLQVTPEPLVHAHLLARTTKDLRDLDLVSLVGQSRLGIYRDGRVAFPVDAGVLDRLIDLFLPGERASPRLPRRNGQP